MPRPTERKLRRENSIMESQNQPDAIDVAVKNMQLISSEILDDGSILIGIERYQTQDGKPAVRIQSLELSKEYLAELDAELCELYDFP